MHGQTRCMVCRWATKQQTTSLPPNLKVAAFDLLPSMSGKYACKALTAWNTMKLEDIWQNDLVSNSNLPTPDPQKKVFGHLGGAIFWKCRVGTLPPLPGIPPNPPQRTSPGQVVRGPDLPVSAALAVPWTFCCEIQRHFNPSSLLQNCWLDW